MEENNTPQAFVNTNGKSGFNLGRFFNRKTFGLLVILILVAAVPLIVMVSQQSQDIRQRASSSANLLPANLQSATFTNDPGTGASGRVWEIPRQSTATTYVLSGSIEGLAARVQGQPYRAEIAVDIYDNLYPQQGHTALTDYKRIIKSSNTSEDSASPQTFTINANYKAYLIFRTYNATANFKEVNLVKQITGPCTGKAVCVFQTRTFKPDGIESITTSDGKYFEYNGINLTMSTDLTAISKYTQANGPCAGKTTNQCVFQTMTYVYSPDYNGEYWESISTSDGKYWNIKNDGTIANTGNYLDPGKYTADKYAAPDGPCYQKNPCVFQTRTFNPRREEFITTSDGKYWLYNGTRPIINGGFLRYALPFQTGFSGYGQDNGPCAGKTTNQCVFQTMTYFRNNGEYWESITTSDGKYWNIATFNGVIVSQGDLASDTSQYVAKYRNPLNLNSANLMPSDLQNLTFTNDPGVGKFDIETSPVARTFTLSGSLNNVSAKVRGVPYKTEIAVDIYDNLYPQQGHTALIDYKRIIKSSNSSEDSPSPLTFTVPANYKAFVMYRLYNATAKFENMSLTYDIPNTPTSTPVPTSTPIPQATSTPVPTNTPIPTIPAGSHAVSGKITSNGRDVQDVKVWILGDSNAQPKTVFTDHLGIFTAQIAGNANYSVRIYNNESAGQATLAWWRKPGSTGTSDSYEQQPASGGCTPNCNFEISFSKQAISGRVTTNTPDHAGVSNLRVWISDISSASVYTGGFFTMATTDTNGNFSAQVAIGSHGYWVRIPNPDANHPDGDYNATLIVPLSGSAAYEQQPFTNTNRGCTPNCNFTADLKSTAVATNTPTPTTITYHLADFNHDQCVGTSDFNLWKDAYLNGQTPQSGISYPNSKADLFAYVIWYNAMKNTSVNHCSN